MSEVAVSVSIARINSVSNVTGKNKTNGYQRKSYADDQLPVHVPHHDRSSSFDYVRSHSNGSSPTIKISTIEDCFLSPHSTNPFLINTAKNQRSKSANLAEDFFFRHQHSHQRIRFNCGSSAAPSSCSPTHLNHCNTLSPNRSISTVSKYSSEAGSPSSAATQSSVRLTDDDDWSDYKQDDDDENIYSSRNGSHDEDSDTGFSNFRRNSSREGHLSSSGKTSGLARLSNSLRESRTRVRKRFSNHGSGKQHVPPKIMVDDHFYEDAVNFARRRNSTGRSPSYSPSPTLPHSPTSPHSSLASTRVVTPSVSPSIRSPASASPSSLSPSTQNPVTFPHITITTAQATFTEDLIMTATSSGISSCINYSCSSEIEPSPIYPMPSDLCFPRSFAQSSNGTVNRKPFVLQKSIFPNVSPTFYFIAEGEDVIPLSKELSPYLKWKLSSITPGLIRETVIRSGFKLMKECTGSKKWLGTWCKHIKSNDFTPFNSCNKVNHFPGSFHLGRKDKLWYNLQDKSFKYGESVFSGFHPTTYILPQDLRLLRKSWINSSGDNDWKMILKPPASARGNGITVINKWSQIPKSAKVRKRHSNKAVLIAQEYISNPCLLFNGAKFDLRIYVLITSFHPLRIYMFNDGLVRFASSKYTSNPNSLSDPFVHLTNYSINKTNESYQSNNDTNSRKGHKWTLSTLWKHLRENEPQLDVDGLRNRITDMIVKTLISCEDSVNKLIKKHLTSRYTSYELLGFDVMIDDQFKPWLLEVNISPSLRSESDLDSSIKGQLIKDMLNLVGYRLPSFALKQVSRSSSVQKVMSCSQEKLSPRTCSSRTVSSSSEAKMSNVDDEKFFTMKLTTEEKEKHDKFEREVTEDDYNAILDDLTPDDVRCLIETEDEFSRRGNFKRIFPCSNPSSDIYMKYFDERRYYNILIQVWLQKYHKENVYLQGIDLLKSLAADRYHLKERTPSPSTDENLFERLFVKWKRMMRKSFIGRVMRNNSSEDPTSDKAAILE